MGGADYNHISKPAKSEVVNQQELDDFRKFLENEAIWYEQEVRYSQMIFVILWCITQSWHNLY